MALWLPYWPLQNVRLLINVVELRGVLLDVVRDLLWKLTTTARAIVQGKATHWKVWEVRNCNSRYGSDGISTTRYHSVSRTSFNYISLYFEMPLIAWDIVAM